MYNFGNEVVHFLQEISYTWAALLFFIENLLIFTCSVYVGNLLSIRYARRRIVPTPPKIEAKEILFATSTIFLNTIVTLLGLWFWRTGSIQFRSDIGVFALLDILILLLVMDAGMYLLHRIAHIPFIYRFAHRTHHRYDKPRPLTLFVLNPLEALGFGALWLLLLCVYDFSWLGMSIYLGLNVVFGSIGHLGVEPLSDKLFRSNLFNTLTTSTFHAMHHQNEDYNFGFYTSIWDRMFGTLYPENSRNQK
ncbi:fatty acid hydroxylase family protein [Leptospira selangorensis]|uniref:Fatty acid hydroxylase family protein n=1 Tax=Leptospira selangorensis TaxID=2484982 RepID=A0A5F2BXV8_9LEPT|nr:sterol desaturase family protein [Leptospira selangorensis]TGM12104.1 fatty acid hydroxylase family protein [Leptospira selangorensis]TGM14853.1 fatty acid hydroxylase family protein [Leptospira selangorensis]